MSIASRSKLVNELIQKKLYKEIESILSIVRQGFDVQVITSFKEVDDILCELLEQERALNSRAFNLIQNSKDIYSKDSSNGEGIDDRIFLPIVFVNAEKIKRGYGFVQYRLPNLDVLVGSVTKSISTILNNFGLDIYLDIFDAHIVSLLKNIASIHGLHTLIDMVVQTAYFAGYLGKTEKAILYLEQMRLGQEILNEETDLSLEVCAKRFLSYVLSKGDEAHFFLKSCLVYYVIRIQGFSVTRASQVMSVSRTTLQDHLKLSEQLGVPLFFEGCVNKPIN